MSKMILLSLSFILLVIKFQDIDSAQSSCNNTTLSITVQGDDPASIWSLKSQDDDVIVLSSTSDDSLSACLSCGTYVLTVHDDTSNVQVKDSMDDFITSCSNALPCSVEVGYAVRIYVHNGTINSTSQSGMGSYHEEISFKLYDSKENLVLSGDAPFDELICLERGMHTLKMTDSFGDGFHDNKVVFEQDNGENIAMCGLTSNSWFPVFQGECTVPVRSCSNVHLDVNTTGTWKVMMMGESSTSILSGRNSFSKELCLECGTYVVDTTEESSAVTWTQVEDDLILSHCESSSKCYVDVGSFVNIAVHAEEGFHHGDWADEVLWKLYEKDGSNNVLLEGGSPYRASVCLSKGQRHLYMEDLWGDGWHNVFLEVTENEENKSLSKCGLADDASWGTCEINTGSCISYGLSSTSSQTEWTISRGSNVVWSGRNGEVCLPCDQYVISGGDDESVLDVVDTENSEIAFECTSSSSSICTFDMGAAMNIEVHAGEFFQGEWQNEIRWKMYDENQNLIVSGGAPQEIEVCMRPGNYEISMYDDWQDGWHDNELRAILHGTTLSTCTITREQGDHSTCSLLIRDSPSPSPSSSPSPSPSSSPSSTSTDSSSDSKKSKSDDSTSKIVIPVVLLLVLGLLILAFFVVKRKMQGKASLPFVFMGHQGSAIVTPRHDMTGVSLSSMDEYAHSGRNPMHTLETLETIDFEATSPITASRRGQMAKDFLDKVSSKRPDEEKDQEDIPIATPITNTTYGRRSSVRRLSGSRNASSTEDLLSRSTKENSVLI